MEKRKCLECKAPLTGRIDKKFCSPYCKSTYHYKLSQKKGISLFVKIDKQLKTNRRILKEMNKSGLSIIRKSNLLELGFDPAYFTHYWKAQNGNVYLFCYEYGFFENKKDDTPKYTLVKWQPYMK